MTTTTNRLNIKPMFRRITGMMVLLCLFGTICAFEICRWFQSSGTNFFSYGSSGDSLFGMQTLIFMAFQKTYGLSLFALCVLFFGGFSFIGLPVTFFAQLRRKFAFFCLPISDLIFFLIKCTTFFAITLSAVFSLLIFIKLRKRFDLLAVRTSFFNHTDNIAI